MFEQDGTKSAMYFDGGSDDLLGEFFVTEIAPCLRVSV